MLILEGMGTRWGSGAFQGGHTGILGGGGEEEVEEEERGGRGDRGGGGGREVR